MLPLLLKSMKRHASAACVRKGKLSYGKCCVQEAEVTMSLIKKKSNPSFVTSGTKY